MITHFKQIKVTADEIEEKLEKIAEFAKTLDLAIKSNFSVDFDSNMVQEIHIDIVPVKYESIPEEEIKCY